MKDEIDEVEFWLMRKDCEKYNWFSSNYDCTHDDNKTKLCYSHNCPLLDDQSEEEEGK